MTSWYSWFNSYATANANKSQTFSTTSQKRAEIAKQGNNVEQTFFNSNTICIDNSKKEVTKRASGSTVKATLVNVSLDNNDVELPQQQQQQQQQLNTASRALSIELAKRPKSPNNNKSDHSPRSSLSNGTLKSNDTQHSLLLCNSTVTKTTASIYSTGVCVNGDIEQKQEQSLGALQSLLNLKDELSSSLSSSSLSSSSSSSSSPSSSSSSMMEEEVKDKKTQNDEDKEQKPVEESPLSTTNTVATATTTTTTTTIPTTTNIPIASQEQKRPVHLEERRWSWLRFSSYSTAVSSSSTIATTPSSHIQINNQNKQNQQSHQHQQTHHEQEIKQSYESKLEISDSPKSMSIKQVESTNKVLTSSSSTLSTATTIIDQEDSLRKINKSNENKNNTHSLLSMEIAQQKKQQQLQQQTATPITSSSATTTTSSLKKTVTLSPSSSTKSQQQQQQGKKRNNVVLPKLETEFIKIQKQEQDTASHSSDCKETNQHSQQRKKPNFIIRAIEAINAVLIEPPPTPPSQSADKKNVNHVDADWLAEQMHTKFSSFVKDIKSADSNSHHNWLDKRITIIGTHGWFPMKIVRSMIGEPTGTSTKFCEQMYICVKNYFEQEHQVTIPDDAITIVPLEGEGKVEDRVECLYKKLIENPVWLEAVSSADVILWATHSQGTPVSTILLQRLLERGHIHTFRQSVCMLAMAGISHGPFPSLKGSFLVKYCEADAARELFEFMNSNSNISIKFRQSLSYVLKCGARVVLTGSMQDQVVPLYSAIMTATHHPNILRQIYIDEHLYSTSDFLVNLIVFLVKLRNRGLSDHGLLTYLSEFLAGNLYAREGGHSTIYEELDVYMTAVRYTFETAPFGQFNRVGSAYGHGNTMWWSQQEEASLEEFEAKHKHNPYYLPWAFRGICSDQDILKDEELKNELKELITLFEQWKPTDAKLKDLKFKLEPIQFTPLM